MKCTHIICIAFTGNIEPLKRYNISVYPVYEQGAGTPTSTEAYLKEGGKDTILSFERMEFKKALHNIPNPSCLIVYECLSILTLSFCCFFY